MNRPDSDWPTAREFLIALGLVLSVWVGIVCLFCF